MIVIKGKKFFRGLSFLGMAFCVSLLCVLETYFARRVYSIHKLYYFYTPLFKKGLVSLVE
jgi:hypothetical protein